MSRNLIFTFFLLLSAPLCAQVVVVKDAQTLDPLPYVTVHSRATRITTTTDASGKLSLQLFSDDDSLRFQYLGYDDLVLSVEEVYARQYEVLLEHDPLTLDEIVVAANRWEQNQREIPFQMEHIAPRDVALQQPQTMADLLSASDRIFMQKSQLGGGSPMIRGFAANRVLMVVDGVRMNNAIFRSGNLQNVISLDPNILEEAEVIFGPASVSYGSDAVGGVMDFHTLDPPLADSLGTIAGGHGMMRFSSANNEATAHADVHLGNDRWSSLTSITASRFGDLRMGANGPSEYLRPWYVEHINSIDSIITNDNPERQVPSGYEQINLMQKLRFQPVEEWDLRLGLHYSTTSDVPRYDRLIEERNGQPRSGQWYYGPQRWFMVNLSARHSGNSLLLHKVKFVAAYQDLQESRNDRSFGSDNLRHRAEAVNAMSFNLDIDAPLGNGFDLYYGAEAVFNGVGSTGEIENIVDGSLSPTSTRYPDGSSWNSYALYANLKVNPAPRLTLMGGMRYNHVGMEAQFDTTFFHFPFSGASLSDGAFTGSLGAVYRPDSGLQVQANLSTGFRAPNIDDVGKVFDSEPGAVVVPNPDLVSEYAYSADLGLIKTFGKTFRLDLSVFYSLLDNAMVRRDYTLDGQDSIMYDGELSRVQAIQNVAEAKVWGVEAGFDFRLGHGLSLASRISWQDGYERDAPEEEKFPVRHVAPLFGATHLRYLQERFDVDLYARYNGAIPYEKLAPSERDKPQLYAIDDHGNPFSPSWFTLNLAVGYKLNGNLQIQAAIENITSQRYWMYSSGIASPGRNFVIALRGTW